MDRNVVAGLFVVLFQSRVKGLHVIIHTCPGHALDRYDADCVLITHVDRCLDVQSRMLHCDRNCSHLDLPELAELLPDHLVGCAHHKVRLVVRLALCLPAFTPSEPGCNTSKHTCLRRSDAYCAGLPFGFLGRMPHVRHHIDTSAAHYCDPRIFGFVDIIYAHGLVHKAGAVVVHICGDESREVQPRLRLRERLVLDDLVGDLSRSLVFRDEFLRCRLPHLL